MKKLLFSIAALLCVSAAWADDGFVVSNIEIPKGGTVNLEVGLNNTDNQCAGFQFKLNLPEGIVVHQVESEYVFTEGSRMSGKGFSTSISYDTDHYQILSYKFPPTTINGTSGTIISITLKDNSNLDVNTVLDASITDCKITDTSGEGSTLLNDELAFTITIGDSRVTLNETYTTAPEASNGPVDVRVYRAINANEWSTICLPFAISTQKMETAFGDNVEVQLGDFAGYVYDENNDKITVNFNNATSIAANHPYIIKVSKAVSEILVDGVDIDPEDEPTVAAVNRTKKQWSEMIGTYVANTVIGEAGGPCLFLNNNKFWYSYGTTTMKAFRAYFDFYDELENKTATSRIALSFGETTGIKDVKSVSNDKVYNLSGQQVKNPAKGIYVKDGKKVIIK